jgi:hypothetical protein
MESVSRLLQTDLTSPLAPEHCPAPPRGCLDAPLPHDRLLCWALMVAPYLSDSRLGEHMPHLLGCIEYFITDDVTRTKLFAESACVLLLDTLSSSSGAEAVRSPAVLQGVLVHPLVATSLHDDDDLPPSSTSSSSSSSFSSLQHKYPNTTTRERLVTALCRLVVRLLPVSIARFVTAHQTRSLLPASVEEIHKLAAEVKAPAGTTSQSDVQATPPSSVSVFGDEAIDLFPSSGGHGGVDVLPAETTGPPSAHSRPSSAADFSGLLAGLGVHLETPGVSLRTLQPPRGESGEGEDSLPPAETALEECHCLVAAGLLIARAAQRCLLWRSDGLAGVSAQFCYLSMLQSLAEVLTPVQFGDRQNADLLDQRQQRPARSASQPGGGSSLLFLSVQWARAAFTDLVHSLLTLLSSPGQGQRRPGGQRQGQAGAVPIAHCVLLPFVTFAAQYLKAMFGKTDAKPKQQKVCSSSIILGCSNISYLLIYFSNDSSCGFCCHSSSFIFPLFVLCPPPSFCCSPATCSCSAASPRPPSSTRPPRRCPLPSPPPGPWAATSLALWATRSRTSRCWRLCS